MKDLFNARDTLKVGDKDYIIYRLDALDRAGQLLTAHLASAGRVTA